MCKVLPRLCVHGNDEMSSERLSEKGTKKMNYHAISSLIRNNKNRMYQ